MLEKFQAMSTINKSLIVVGTVVAVYFIYKAVKK